MSTSPDPAYAPRPEPTKSNLWISVLGILGTFLIFGFVLVVAYVPSRQEPAKVDFKSIEEDQRWKYDNAARKQRLVELQSKKTEEATTYGWVDQSAGVVRLPIDRAMALVVQENSSKK